MEKKAILVRLTEEKKNTIILAAKKSGLSTEAYIRYHMIKLAEKELQEDKTTC